MNITTDTPHKPVRQIGKRSKYRFIYDRLDSITEHEALLVTCDEDDKPVAMRAAIYKYLRDLELSDKYSVFLLEGSKIKVQLKSEAG